jgi:hypothetical protein
MPLPINNPLLAEAILPTGSSHAERLLASTSLPEPFLASYGEAGRLLGGLSRDAIQQLVGRGELRAKIIGARTLIDVASIRELIVRSPSAVVTPRRRVAAMRPTQRAALERAAARKKET